MTIEKLGGIEHFKNVQNKQQTQRTIRARTSDSINLSPVAQKSMEVHLAMEAVKAAPDVRREKIEEVSKKLQDPAYIDSVLDNTAEKILVSFGF